MGCDPRPCSNPEVPSAECSVYPCRAKGFTTAVGETPTRKVRSLQPKSCARWAVQGRAKSIEVAFRPQKHPGWGEKDDHPSKKTWENCFETIRNICMRWNGINRTHVFVVVLILDLFGGLLTLIWNS